MKTSEPKPTKEEILNKAEHEIDFPGHPNYGKKVYTFSKEELQEYADLYHKEKLKEELKAFNNFVLKLEEEGRIPLIDTCIDDFIKTIE